MLTGLGEGASQEELARGVLALGPEARSSSPAATARTWSTSSSTASGWSRSPVSATRAASAHGSGCTHSSALAAFLARGAEPLEAARQAREIASEAVGAGLREIGTGPGPVDVLNVRVRRASPVDFRHEHQRHQDRPPAPPLGHRLRRSRPRPLARLHEGDRLRRRRPQPADDRDRQHLDRGDALQLPPARPGRARQGGRPRRRRHADGVQHRRRLRRGDDGNPGDEGLADQPRGDRRLDRADGPRLPVRRDRRPLRLRQDDPRLRDGAGPARRALGAALRRLDRPRPLARPRRHDPRHLRGDRRPQRRRHERRGTERARGRRQSRRRRLRRPVHRQHDGLCLRGAGDQRRRLGDGPGRRRRQGDRRREDRRAGDQRPRRRHHARAR